MHIGSNNTATFETMASFADWMRPDRCLRMFQGQPACEWTGGTDCAGALHMLRNGDKSQVANAERLLSTFDIRIETAGSVMEVGVAGFCPSVPDFLGGSPESMFYMGEAPNAAAPLKVIVDPTSSSAVKASILSKRGTSILAAVMALSATRPVTLEMACVMDCDEDRRANAGGNRFSVLRVGVNSAPLDLGSACFALSHPAFARLLMYGASQTLFGAPIQWPELRGVDMRNTRSEATRVATLQAMGEDPDQVLFIPAAHLTDELVTDPKQWIDSVLAKYGQPATA